MKALTQLESRHHRLWMLCGAAASWAVLGVPLLIYRTSQHHDAIFGAGFFVTAIILGIGRQGIDVLFIRLFGVTSTLLLIGALVAQGDNGRCSVGWTCAHWVVLGAVGSGLVSAILATVAVPTTILWNRGVASLAPELPWRALKPRTWWQVVLLVLGIVVLVAGLDLLLGIPSV